MLPNSFDTAQPWRPDGELPSEWFAIEELEINLNGSCRHDPASCPVPLRGLWPRIEGRVIPITVAAPWYANPLNILYLGVLMGLSVGLPVLTRVRILMPPECPARTDGRRADQAQTSLDLQETYLQEVHHRVKNNLQIIQSVCSTLPT